MNCHKSPDSRKLATPGISKAMLLTAGLLFAGAHAGAYAEDTQSRSFVVGYFSNAASSTNEDCVGGPNPDIGEQYRRNLAALGHPDSEIDRLMDAWLNRGPGANELPDLMTYRARINGEPANAYAHPEAVIDPELKSNTGPYGYGFNLSGSVDEWSFEDPETGEQGIDHRLFRALGCIEQFRGTANNDPTYWTWLWTMIRDSMPAWLITVSGQDLDGDGEVNVRIERAMEHVRFNTNGQARPYLTYRADPDPRWQNEFRGRIDDGVLTLTEPGHLRLMKDPLSFPELELLQFQLRLELADDGTVQGLIGGYQPWAPIYFAFGQTSFGGETMITGDIPGTYFLLKKHADYDPDPETGQNRAISAAYRLSAVPAFVVSQSGSETVLR